MHLKEGNAQMKWLWFHTEHEPAQLGLFGKMQETFCRSSVLMISSRHHVIFGPACRFSSLFFTRVDGDAIPGPSPDPAADGAPLRHPGVQAGVV